MSHWINCQLGGARWTNDDALLQLDDYQTTHRSHTHYTQSQWCVVSRIACWATRSSSLVWWMLLHCIAATHSIAIVQCYFDTINKSMAFTCSYYSLSLSPSLHLSFSLPTSSGGVCCRLPCTLLAKLAVST